MWLSKKNLKAEYDTELLKQTESYTYYIKHVENNDKDVINEGEHENVPFICMKETDNCESEEQTELVVSLIEETNTFRTYECGDYFIYESVKGVSSDEERLELVTNAYKLNADYIYSDVDNITCDGKRIAPFYKPCFSKDTAKCFDYFSDFYAVKKMKSKMDIQCYEKISHIEKVLFHYIIDNNNCNPNEVYKLNNKGYETSDFYVSEIGIQEDKDCISIIIPSKDRPDLIRTCLAGIEKAKIKSGINTLNVVIVDNGSTDIHKKEITDVINGVKQRNTGISVSYLYEQAEFNFSYMCNRGAKESTGKYLLFMNDDIEITDEQFLLKMLYFAKMDHVGAVGCKLLYPGEERRIQHVGITCLKYPGPSHKLSTFSDDEVLYFGRNRGVHNVLAVTAACLMVSNEKFFKIGGFHDKMKVGYNDVDLCVSLYENGYLNVVNNEACLVHHESISRGRDSASEEKLKRLDQERNLLYERHPWLLTEGDPYYNVNLAEDFLDYRVNVIPDFERRDYESLQKQEYNAFVNKAEHAAQKANAVPATKNMFMNVEEISRNRNFMEIRGWALINKKINYLYDTFITVMGEDGNFYTYETVPVKRDDLKEVFPEALNTELSGFFARVPASSVKLSDDGELLRCGVLIINKQTGKKYYAGFRKADI
ncbi:MAG: glycosyltransferase [Lachnospiraceae bacterium]|nr:glycosyltransferase [Lachnospiraceae bacterium]